jgi:alginate O-acetyltransferase complex protein AlgI
VLFNSFHFVVFFVVVLALNQTLRRWPTAQKLMLLAASYYFYGQWSWLYLLLILFSTATDYAIGLGLVRVSRPRQLLIISLCVNLGVLFFFKYANWVIANWNAIEAVAGVGMSIAPLDLLLPIGISFYTFQSMSYTIDVYRGDCPPRRSPLDFSLFIAFFPQLVAGPIVRDNEFFHELDRERIVDFSMVRQGLILIALGYVKKMVIADNLALVVDPVFNATVAQPFWDTLLAIYAFAFQIYCDFSGYTDIAIGCALLLGFCFPKNFNYPYAAESIQDFWRRWHMTLSRWLRDYLYISLGGNRKGPGRTRINLMLTMLLGGLWHGASWNFVIWGGLHGAFLSFERALERRWPQWKNNARSMRVIRILVTFHLVCFAWIFFRASNLEGALLIISNLGDFSSMGFNVDRHLGLCILLMSLFLAQFLGNNFALKRRMSESQGPLFVGALTLAMLALIWFSPTTSTPFIYFQF